MIKKTVTYTDFDGNERTEDLYFNLTKNEMLEMAFEMPEVTDTVGTDPDNVDVDAASRMLVEKLGNAGIVKFIKDLVFKAYGVKSEDGRRFIKSPELSTEFTQTMAYDEFIMSLLSNDEDASEFVKGVIPANMAQQAKKPKKLPVKK